MGKLYSIASILFGLSLLSCNGITFPLSSQIIAHVHWQEFDEAGKKIVLVEIKDTMYTDTSGLTKFIVPAGHYTLRAFGINRAGPCCRPIDFTVDVAPNEIKTVDIVDCLPCV